MKKSDVEEIHHQTGRRQLITCTQINPPPNQPSLNVSLPRTESPSARLSIRAAHVQFQEAEEPNTQHRTLSPSKRVDAKSH